MSQQFAMEKMVITIRKGGAHDKLGVAFTAVFKMLYKTLAVWALICLTGCATPSTNYRIPKAEFASKVKTIAILPLERTIVPDRMILTWWPVKDSSIVLDGSPIEFQRVIKDADQVSIDSFATAVEQQLVERFRAQGFQVITPSDCDRIRVNVYLENGIVTQADRNLLERDSVRQRVIRREWMRALPSEYHATSTAIFTIAHLMSFGTSFNGTIYAGWDDRRMKMFAVSNALVQGRMPALSIGIAIWDTTETVLWSGRGGLALIKEHKMPEQLQDPDNVKKAIQIATYSLEK